MNDHHDNDELRDAPGLKDLRRSDPFAVPEGFFEQFPQRVQQRVVQLERQNERRIPFGRWTWYGAAAMAMLAFGIYFLQPGTPTSATSITDQTAALNVDPEELDLESWDQIELYASLNDDRSTIAITALESDELAAYIEHEELPLDLILEEL
ncbi:MAG: hypothetical protein JNL52_02840 [Flavobacteriales bacterium]|nr:hypothetical protein [Flavobacteriales bacterium]